MSALKYFKSFEIPVNVVANTAPCGDDKYTEGFNQQSITGQYLYDNSGNQTYDPNKKLTYYYNYLNLPYRIVGEENDELQMLYSADGTLVQRKYLKNSAQITKKDYLGTKEYQNGILESIYHSEGRVIKNGSSLKYEYHIKDHLGNNRVAFIDDNNDGLINGAELKSLHDYYAYGMEWNGVWKKNENIGATPYRYGGKEMVIDMNLQTLNFHARMMDPVLGRFTSPDPLSGVAPGWTGYRYGFNNPIKYTDPDGMYESSNSLYNDLKEQQQKDTNTENSINNESSSNSSEKSSGQSNTSAGSAGSGCGGPGQPPCLFTNPSLKYFIDLSNSLMNNNSVSLKLSYGLKAGAKINGVGAGTGFDIGSISFNLKYGKYYTSFSGIGMDSYMGLGQIGFKSKYNLIYSDENHNVFFNKGLVEFGLLKGPRYNLMTGDINYTVSAGPVTISGESSFSNTILGMYLATKKYIRNSVYSALPSLPNYTK